MNWAINYEIFNECEDILKNQLKMIKIEFLLQKKRNIKAKFSVAKIVKRNIFCNNYIWRISTYFHNIYEK